MREALEFLVSAAIQAPSGDNTQPWRFVLSPAEGTIDAVVDPTRDTSPMNAGQTMARIALGAAVENIVRTARLNGWGAQTCERDGGQQVRIRVETTQLREFKTDPLIAQRVTNRKMFDGGSLTQSVINDLQQQTPTLEGVTVSWITDDHLRSRFARLAGLADAQMFGIGSMRRAFLRTVHTVKSAAGSHDAGLPIETLELSKMDRVGFRVLPMLNDMLFAGLGVRAAFARKAKRLVRSAAGLCLISSCDDHPSAELHVGRAMQRAWLALANNHLAVQPMMSALVLGSALKNGDAALKQCMCRRRIDELWQSFRDLSSDVSRARPAALLRFGYATSPSARTTRRPVSFNTSHENALHECC